MTQSHCIAQAGLKLINVLATKSDDLGLFSKPRTRWEERIDSCRLPFDLYVCVMVLCAIAQKKENV